MSASASRFWWIVTLLVFALVVSASFLQWHLALMVVVGCLLGTVLATPRRSVVLAAVLLTPLALLALIVSTTTWKATLLLPTDATLVLPVGLLVGGAAICSLLPYAVARWSRLPLSRAMLAWIGGLLMMGGAAALTVPFLLAGNPFSRPAMNAVGRGMNYANWLTYSLQIGPVEYVAYEAHIELTDCEALPQQSWTLRIPAEARKKAEKSLFGESFLRKVTKWFSYSSDGDGFPCSTTTTEEADLTIVVKASCAPTNAMKTFVRKYPAAHQGFNTFLPMVRLATPDFVPGKDSLLTITAPRGCIADTFPAPTRIESERTTETLTLRVGFPRDAFSLLKPQRIVEDPAIVSVEFLKPALRGKDMLSLLRALNSPVGLGFVVVLAALTSRSLALRLGRRVLQFPYPNSVWLRLRDWCAHSGQVITLSLAAAALAAATFVLPNLPLVLVAILLDRTYWLAIALFMIALCTIEVIAFILRRLTRKIPPPLPLGA
jgi:hypothetical protein